MSEPRLLSNRYEIGDTLGYGGMSEVHRGRDIRLGRDVAVKVLRADLARDPTFQLRFRREAQNAAALNHPAIVAVYDTGETESENGPLPYIVMEYVDGRTLRDIVKAEGPLPARRAMEVMADASAALDFSHRHGIVHRDVKPANIMITGSGAVKVMDFGIARAVADGQAAVTQTAAVIGTAQYLSPEQARGETVDARSDVYASGCVLFELVCGEPPFTGDSPVAVAYQHVREDPRKPSDVNENVPASLDAVVLKALSKNPANRYQSAAEMRADLVRVLSGQRPKAPMIMSEEERTSMLAPAGATELTARGGRHRPDDDYTEQIAHERGRKRRRAWTVALVTIASVAVVALVAWGVVLFRNMNSAPTTVAVPNFTHESVDQAMTSPQAKGWKMTQSVCPSSPQDVGLVVSQDPQPGSQAVQGSQITLCRGTGPEQKPVPDLTGQTLLQAQSNLINAGLKLGQTRERTVQDPSQDGKVLDWDHRSGTVPTGTAINVTVGRKQQVIPVPSVVGQPFDAAQATLSSTNFRVKQVQQPGNQPAGTVLSQTPPGGSNAPPNSEVTLTVSDGSLMQMPSLIGMSKDQAMQTLRAAYEGQLQEGQDQETNDFSQVGKILQTQPQAGQTISKDQPIIVSVGKYELAPTSSSPNGGGGSGGGGGGLFPSFD
jgi:serine/threonine-protein kinase